MSEWISVDKVRPQMGEVVAVWDIECGYIPFVEWDGDEWISHNLLWSGKLSHWQPIPGPPE